MRYVIIALLLIANTALADAFDHQHKQFTELLQKHVVSYDAQRKSAVDYGTLAADSASLQGYLESISAVSNGHYDEWTDAQQLAFLINAYNAFTLQLIVQNYDQFTSGEADSIRDLGGLFSSPWQQEFFVLLGQQRSLDWLEHEKIRVDFTEPRIHAALVCAALSCPKLRTEAYQADVLQSQLEDQLVTFLSDRDYHGFDADGLYLSKIFDWYNEDFESGGRLGLLRYFQPYAGVLTDGQLSQLPITTRLRFVDYDWTLNSVDNMR
ncbi:MAG: Uncharacterised protein [Pseudidiomarina mangrovi]|nr:MAG: Uncharacterised protein [Pseudidiomarina mangrovi]